jgi:hypothetical protein
MADWNLPTRMLQASLAEGQPECTWDQLRPHFFPSGDPWASMTDWYLRRGVAPVPDARRNRNGESVEWVRFYRV